MALFTAKQTVAPIAQPTPAPAEYLRFGRESGVSTPIIQNAWGGFAVALLVFIAAYVVNHFTAQLEVLELIDRVWIGAALTGSTVFALMTAVRMFRDEVSFIVANWAQAHDAEAAKVASARIEELERLLSEASKAGQVSHEYAAQVSAEKMLRWVFEDKLPISRTECMKRGMTRPDWDAATLLLRNAGVMGENGKLLIEDSAEAWRLVIRRTGASNHMIRSADGQFVKV
jgi:hypothetical protein